GLQPPQPGGVANFRGERNPVSYNDRLYTYNFAPYNALQLPLERVSAFGRAEFEFNESAHFYSQLLWSGYSVTMRLAPTPVGDLYVPVTNPYVPADLLTLLDSRSDPTAPFTMIKRMVDIGPRMADDRYNVYQLTAGLKGALGAGWHYDG